MLIFCGKSKTALRSQKLLAAASSRWLCVFPSLFGRRVAATQRYSNKNFVLFGLFIKEGATYQLFNFDMKPAALLAMASTGGGRAWGQTIIAEQPANWDAWADVSVEWTSDNPQESDWVRPYPAAHSSRASAVVHSTATSLLCPLR